MLPVWRVVGGNGGKWLSQKTRQRRAEGNVKTSWRQAVSWNAWFAGNDETVMVTDDCVWKWLCHMFAFTIPLIHSANCSYCWKNLEKLWLQEIPGMASNISQISQASSWSSTEPARVVLVALDELLRLSVWTSSYLFLLKVCKWLWMFVAEAMEGHFSYLFLSVYSAGLFCGSVTG